MVVAGAVVAPIIVDAADLPDRAGAGNLHQRRVRRIDEARFRIGVPRVADRAVLDQIPRSGGPEADGGRAVDATGPARDRLIGLARAARGTVWIMPLLALLAVERETK